MTKDEFGVVESILFALPEVCRALQQRRDYIISMVLAPNHDEPVQGGTGISSIQHFVEGDRESNNLKIIIDRGVLAIKKLCAEEREFVRRYYFRREAAYEFDVSEGAIFRARQRACRKMMGLLSVYHLVREWREIEEDRRIEAAKISGAL